jgi:hypothetical protein
MKKDLSVSRRNFLKSSAVATAGIAMLGPAARKAAAADIPTQVVNLSQTQINQNIDNLRVAFITDPAMLKANPTWGSFDTFNNPTNTNGVVYAVVKTNMDKLACALANKAYPAGIADAWSTIFKLPAGKTWATATAAFKVNGFTNNHPSVPIVAKICEVLTGLGMPAANITLMDAGPYGSYMGAGKQIPNGVLTSTARATTLAFPAPDTQKFTVADPIATADIVGSIAVNKGHDGWAWASGVTMAQKNHYWTFNNFGHTTMEMLAKANSCDFLIGKIPGTYPAKQQLCIVDSLWLGDNGSWQGAVTNGNNANTIAMATFAGALDYVSTMKIRATKFHATTVSDSGVSGWNQTIVNKFLSAYGYDLATASATLMAAKTAGAGPGTVDANNFTPDPVGVTNEGAHQVQAGTVQIDVAGNGIKPMHTSLNFARGETVQSAEIFNVQGRKVRTLALTPGSNHIVWDGRTNSGSFAKPGNYVARIKGQRTTTSGNLVLSR